MKLYFLRHAEAEEGPVDAERALTGKGHRDSRRVGRYLDRLGVTFDAAFASPLVRAQQTAKLVLKHCRLRRSADFATTDLLLNDAGAATFSRWLSRLPHTQTILLVGHEPSLSGHVRNLLGLASAEAFPLAKGAIARVDSDNGRTGTLKLLVAPKHLP